MSEVRRKLARRIEEAFRSQHGLDVSCDPADIDFPKGFYRTQVQSDTYRWSARCTMNGTRVGPSVDSYDTATACARYGVTINKLPYWRGWEATVANADAELLRDANSHYSTVQIEEIERAGRNQ